MRTLNWRHTGWFVKNFIFTVEQQFVGQLTFYRFQNSNALYTDKETQLEFVQKSFWDRDVSITKDGKTIGEIHSGIFGEKTLKLLTGERFILSTGFWEQEVYWKTEKGETVIKYQQEAMSSMGKGLISSKEILTTETEKLLVSSGIFARQLAHRRRTLIVAVMMLIIAAASQS